jgi:hypothetical protein
VTAVLLAERPTTGRLGKMDPNEALRSIRRCIAELDKVSDADEMGSLCGELIEHVEALDQWLSQGGFPPDEWRDGPDQHPEHISARG